MKLLLGSNNANKASVVREHVRNLPVEVLQPADISLILAPQETEKTALENARLKALAFFRATGLPCIAEDSGLVFLDLPRSHPDQPGIHVRRANGHDMTDEEMISYFALIAHKHGGKLRSAWLDAWALVIDEEHVFTFEADEDYAWAFYLVDAPCRARCPGWPLDSIAVSMISGEYKAEISDESRPFFHQEISGNPAKEWLTAKLKDYLI